MPDKQKYALWIAEQPNVPIFLQSWWMDAVSIGKHWEVKVWETQPKMQCCPGAQASSPAECSDTQCNLGVQASSPAEDNGEVIAAMPYLLRQRLGMRFVVMPQMTQLAGAWLASNANPETIADAIDSHLKFLHLSYYYQQFPINSPIPALLAQRGYTVSPRVTYRIEDCTDVEKIIAGYNRNKQRQLKKSTAFTLRQDNISPHEFYHFHQSALAAQGKVISYSELFLRQLLDAVLQHHQGTVLTLYDNQSPAQTMIAVALYVWDADAVHYLIAVQHPDYQHSGLMARLVTEGIRLAHQRHLAFDFEGSMIPGVAKHFAQFGAIPAIYYSVERCFNPLFRLFTSVYKYLTRRKR